MSVGPAWLMPTKPQPRSGESARTHSSYQISCWARPSPRPPYSAGQLTPAYPPSNWTRCQAMSNARRAARSVGAGSRGTWSASQSRTSARNSSSSATSVSSTAAPASPRVRRGQQPLDPPGRRPELDAEHVGPLEIAMRGVLVGEPDRTVVLDVVARVGQRRRGRDHRRRGDVQLGLGTAGVELDGSQSGQRPGRLGPDGHVGAPMLDGLEAADRAAVLHPVDGVAGRVVPGAFGNPDEHRGSEYRAPPLDGHGLDGQAQGRVDARDTQLIGRID